MSLALSTKTSFYAHTLFRGQKPQFIGSACSERIRVTVVAILENDSQAVGRIHKYLDNLKLFLSKGNRGLKDRASLPVSIFS